MKKARRGYILVQALVVIAGLLALMAMLAADLRVSAQATQNRLRQRRADAAADAAVARALAAVQETHPETVSLNDDWAQTGGGREEYNLGDAAFRVQLVDGGALVNINVAPEEQLQRLPLTPEQVHCLLDWREPKTQPRPDGAKDAYYLALPTPYNAKLGPLATVDELLQVKGWTGQTLYQSPVNSGQTPADADGNALPLAAGLTADSGTPTVRADGSPRLDLSRPGTDPNALLQAGVSAGDAARIAQTQFTSFRTLLALPGLQPQTVRALLDSAAFSAGKRATGKINVNTASEAVLRTVPGMTNALASAIVSRQGGSGFHRLSELADLPGMTPALLASLADSLCVGSDTWVVRAYGASGGASAAVEAVVGLRDGRAVLLTWTKLGTPGLPAWWGWNARPETTEDAGDAH